MTQVLLPEHHDVVEALPSDRANQTFRIAVLPGRARRRRAIANAQRLKAAGEDVAVTGIPVTNQMGGDQIPAAGLRELIGKPFRTRMRRYPKPQDLSSAMTHDQQAVQEPERHRWYHE